MSAVPITLPKCTRTVVLDLLFKRKHNLSQTEATLMYYLILLKTWVKYQEDEHYVILSSKIEKDLKLHPKTVEASLTKLKKLNLITSKRVVVEDWNPNRTYRAIGITELGKEYNLSHYKPNQTQKISELTNENKELELKLKALEINKKSDERLTIESIEAIDRAKKLEEKYLELEEKYKKLKKQVDIAENNSNNPTEEKQREEDIKKFRDKIIKEFARSGKPICNALKNPDNWAVGTKFYINGYSRLTMYTSEGKSIQLSDPKKINNFWEWLFEHQHRVGTLLDENRVADISALIAFIGAFIFLKGKRYKIDSFVPVVGGVKVILADDFGVLAKMGNSYGGDVFDVQRARYWIGERIFKKSDGS